MLARNDPSAPLPVGALEASREVSARKPYQFLLVNVLREYLALEFAVDAPFPLDVERVFDDFGARPAAAPLPPPAVVALSRAPPVPGGPRGLASRSVRQQGMRAASRRASPACGLPRCARVRSALRGAARRACCADRPRGARRADKGRAAAPRSVHVLLRRERLPAAHADAGDPRGRHRAAHGHVQAGAAAPGLPHRRRAGAPRRRAARLLRPEVPRVPWRSLPALRRRNAASRNMQRAWPFVK